MTTTQPRIGTPAASPRTFKLSEDWLATGIGLVIVLVIGAGLIGPGPQKVSVKAAPGETASAQAVAANGWEISATVGDAATPIQSAITDLNDGDAILITCEDGALSAQIAGTLPDGTSRPDDDNAVILVTNSCDAPVSITYTRAAAIPWPIFNLFD
jgi:hypothetical protein